MVNQQFQFISLLALTTLIGLTHSSGPVCALPSRPLPLHSAANKGGGSVVPSSLRLSAQVSEMAIMCNAVGISLDNSKIPGVVTKVRPGTAAAYSGLLEGDRIIASHWDDNSMTIDFNRLGAHYKVILEVRMKEVRASWDEQIRQSQSPAQPQTAGTTRLSADISHTQDPDREKFFKTLAPYQVILLIDHSGSMNGGLGIGPIDISRWSWCRNQITGFSRFCGDKLKGGITLIPFNDTFEVREHASSQDVEAAFDNIVPSGETDIYSPLKAVIRSHLSDPDHAKKPILIVVLTDGIPNLGGSLDQLISHATDVLKNNDEMIISFLMIGQAPEGDELIDRLEHTRSSDGAKTEIVDSMHFAKLLDIGLKNAVLETVSKARARHNE